MDNSNHLEPGLFPVRAARDLREATGAEVAAASGVTVAAISHYETGRTRPSPAVATEIAKYLRVPVSLISRVGRLPRTSLAYYSGRSEPSPRTIRAIKAYAVMLALAVEDCAPGLSKEVPSLPPDPQRAAREVRGLARIVGPVPDVVRVCEEMGAYVHQLPRAAGELHFAAMWVATQAHVFLNQADRDPYRSREDAAEALGHVVMHRGRKPGIEENRRAKLFAAELLLPSHAWSADPLAHSKDLTGLFPARSRWHVSLLFMLRRALELRLLDQVDYDRISGDYRARHWVGAEPGARMRPYELPTRLGALIGNVLLRGETLPQFSERIGVPFDVLTDVLPAGGLELDTSACQ